MKELLEGYMKDAYDIGVRAGFWAGIFVAALAMVVIAGFIEVLF